MIYIVKPVLTKMSNAIRLHVRCIYTTTNDLRNIIKMMQLQAHDFELFEKQKALLHQWYHEK